MAGFNLSIGDLIDIEKAARIVTEKYENEGHMYRGKLVEEGTKDFEKLQEITKNLSMFNSIRLRAIKEMEERLLKLDNDENAL